MSLICSKALTQLCQRRKKPYISPLLEYSRPSAASVVFVTFVHWSEARGFVSSVGNRRSGGDVVVFGGLVVSCESSVGGVWTSCADTGRMPRKMMLTAIRRDILNVIELRAHSGPLERVGKLSADYVGYVGTPRANQPPMRMGAAVALPVCVPVWVTRAYLKS